MRSNSRAPLVLGVTTLSTLALVCAGLFFIASTEGKFPRITEAPFAGGRGAAYFMDSGRQEGGLQNVLYAGFRCERGKLLIWADKSIVSAARPAAGLPYRIDGYEMILPADQICGPNHEAIP